MTRQTSIECYRTILESGLLTGLKLKVFECILEHGAMTQGECLQYFESSDNPRNTGSINTRFSELKRMGAIIETQIRPCRITGVMCYEWDITDELPKPDIRPETWKDKAIRLEKENAALKEILKRNDRAVKVFSEDYISGLSLFKDLGVEIGTLENPVTPSRIAWQIIEKFRTIFKENEELKGKLAKKSFEQGFLFQNR